MINLNHDIAEIEIILKHLGMGAYAEVAGIIQKIRDQAIPQVAKIQQNSVVSTQQVADESVAEIQQ
jgi:hypothetical protein